MEFFIHYMAFDEVLAERVRAWFLNKGVDAEEKHMMGGLCFMVDGKMCLGIIDGRLMVRLDPSLYEACLERPGCSPMDFTGRPMKGFVWVDEIIINQPGAMHQWGGLALEFNPRAKATKKRK